MKYVRFSRNGESRYGILDGNKIAVLNGDLFGEHEESGEVVDLDAVKLLAPCLPSKIMCAGTNYMSHIIECREKMNLDVSIPEHPLIFSKGPNTIADPEQGVIYPTGVNRVDFEGELGVVIGKRCKKATRENAMDYVLGYTCVNDVSARDMQWSDGQWTRGKGLDTFCPMGPMPRRKNISVRAQRCLPHILPALRRTLYSAKFLPMADIIRVGILRAL